MLDSKLMTLIHVAKLRSFTKAAQALNLTQPAVTRHIKQLEEHYGVQLIRKSGRQFSLTEEGEMLLQYAKESDVKAVLLERMLKNKSALAKHYNIGATLTIGEYVLPDFLGRHKKLYPYMDIIMQVGNSEVILKKLSAGEIDLGVIEGPFDKNRFRYEKLKDDELVLAASPQSGFAALPKVEMADVVKSGKLILREKGSGTRQIFENRLLELGFDPSDMKIYMEVGSIGAIKSLVEANLGYTVISWEAVRRETEMGSLAVIPIDGVRMMREFNFIYLEHGPLGFIRDFMNFLKSP